MKPVSVTSVTIRRWSGETLSETEDLLAVEEPMELRLVSGSGEHRTEKSISVTMRTPGHDEELATGFLFTEGLIHSAEQLAGVAVAPHDPNIVVATLKPDIQPRLNQLERHFYTTSSCGVCGKSSIDAVKTVSSFAAKNSAIRVSREVLTLLPEQLRESQHLFGQTGGLHACALFDPEGGLLLLREDVGRHNALDKLIGAGLREGLIPMSDHVLLLSGRASFELVQKAAMAGIGFIAAVGAPSSLAVDLARDNGITLAGFLRNGRFNIYCGAERISV